MCWLQELAQIAYYSTLMALCTGVEGGATSWGMRVLVNILIVVFLWLMHLGIVFGYSCFLSTLQGWRQESTFLRLEHLVVRCTFCLLVTGWYTLTYSLLRTLASLTADVPSSVWHPSLGVLSYIVFQGDVVSLTHNLWLWKAGALFVCSLPLDLSNMDEPSRSSHMHYVTCRWLLMKDPAQNIILSLYSFAYVLCWPSQLQMGLEEFILYTPYDDQGRQRQRKLSEP